nr:hypothetical protein [Tanacetum cinerariifolium]
VLFDAECESNSSDDQSCSDENVLEKIISKPLSEEEIIPMKSLHTHDSSLLISSKIDSLLDDYTCKSCGKDAHIGYNYPSKVLVISNLVPCDNQTIDELPQALPSFISTFHYEAESPFTLDSTPTYVDESPNVFNPPSQPPREEKRIEEEQAAKAQTWKLPVCYDDDDDEERSDSLNDNIISGLPPFFVITPDEPVLSTEEPDNSLSMGDEHLDTIPATESNEFIKSEVMEIVIPEAGGIKASNDNPIPFYDQIIPENPPNLTPSGESDFFLESSSTSLNSLLKETNNFDNSLHEFTTFSKVLFDAECEYDSSDDQSSSDEDVLEKIVLKPLFEEDIISMESLRIYDSSLPISSKIDSLLDEFAGELTLLKSIPLGIDEADCNFEEDIRLIEKLLYDNSSPRPPEEFVSANSDAASESFSPSPILVKDSDILMEEIDLLCISDYPMPPGIMDKDYDSERDILIPKDLPSNNTLSFAEKESFHFDIPSFSRPPAKPPDGDTGILNIKMMGDISDQKAFIHKLMITLASHQEKSPDLLSHRCGTVKKFNTHRSHLNICPMLINGQNNPPLDVLLFHFYPS